MSRAIILGFISLLACGGEVKAPIPEGFTGKCELSVPRDVAHYARSFQTADQAKSHVRVRIAKDVIVGLHVEVPDNRHAEITDTDHPLATADAAPNLRVDRDGDVDIPLQLRGQGEPWDVVIRIRFRDDHAEVVAGLMIVSGPCIVAPPEPAPE
jgi:hypothetical protein